MNHLETVDFERASVRTAIRLQAVGWLCAWSAFILLGLYLLLAMHIRLDLGRWPVPMFEKYQEPASFQLHSLVLVLWSFFSVFAAGPIWLLCQFVGPLRPPSRQTSALQLATLLGGWVCMALVYNFDPTPFTDWFLD